MTTLTRMTTDLLEFARELGQRFPDYTDAQIQLACEEYAGRRLPEYAIWALRWEYVNNGIGRNPWL